MSLKLLPPFLLLRSLLLLAFSSIFDVSAIAGGHDIVGVLANPVVPAVVAAGNHAVSVVSFLAIVLLLL